MVVDAIVVGAGPNGLTAAVTLAEAGLSVRVYEARSSVGGGAVTEELTLPGYRHDPCSAVHPLGAGSPAFLNMPLGAHGLRWVEPELALAQTVADGPAAVLARDPAETGRSLGRDAGRYQRLLGPFLGRWEELAAEVLRPPGQALPRSPLLLAAFGVPAVLPAGLLVRGFRDRPARTLLSGLAAHVLAPLGSPLTGGVALMFALAAHEVGWPFPLGGAQSLSDALASYLVSLGGEIELDRTVRHIEDLPAARAYLFDVSPQALAAIAGSRLPRRWTEHAGRYRYGPGVYKVDYALSGPMPWLDESCRRAGTVHVAGSSAEIAESLRAANSGRAPTRPFLITSQPTVFDPTRAPAGGHTFWAYAHVPNGWDQDLLGAVEDQLERHAPGFRDLVLARHISAPKDLEARNPNNVGGNITVGRGNGLHGMARPWMTARIPYATGNRALYLCSSATSPGPGVHGMCGYHAAGAALRGVFGLEPKRLDTQRL
ncbi:phytoene desaturase family protein [Streptacidiphilus sp. PAMC 29251]